jgi:type IV pilus assembly protein PilM
MSESTYHLNEQALAFINEFEEKIPKSVYITNFTTSDSGVNVGVMATGYDDVAQLIVNLKSISIIDDVYVAAVSTVRSDGAADDVFQFSLSCKYVKPAVEEEEAE